MSELRRIVEKVAGHAKDGMSDYALHNEGVRFARRADLAGKLLQKALDRTHQLSLKRFNGAKDAGALCRLWEEAKRCGDIAGAYWAAMSHPAASESVMDRIFHDIHMLSHLAGASNRSDIRRLALLEAEKAELERKLQKQQAQLEAAISGRDEAIRQRNDLLAQQAAREPIENGVSPSIMRDGERLALTEVVAQLRRNLGIETERSARLEVRCAEEICARSEAEKALRDAILRENLLCEELAAVETQLSPPDTGRGEKAGISEDVIEGATLLYVGGRPGQVLHIRAQAERYHVTLLHHDGGVEEKRGLLAGMVSRAEVVFFPVDCVSHDAVATLKRLCRQAGKPYHPLRSGSVTSFLAALQGLNPQLFT
jgi:hypothetical protein